MERLILELDVLVVDFEQALNRASRRQGWDLDSPALLNVGSRRWIYRGRRLAARIEALTTAIRCGARSRKLRMRVLAELGECIERLGLGVVCRRRRGKRGRRRRLVVRMRRSGRARLHHARENHPGE